MHQITACKHNGTQYNAGACVTGKSLIMGGIEGRSESTGYGVFLCVKDLLNDKDLMNKYKLPMGLEGKKFIVQV